ncbi:hypothetical protein W97_08388 [Coniosporium apollinis CBS 100218]|uniref:Uncharacterized protein n=1 Tax=Coniosporium apollinis (strain CBS 100218) TaxID=1168221 RepID=R7Z4I0_CONA1|nr:uncharacterized protein W97_08388 [Coniosporium apollinis CBS 100218]EON69075.1 hypothetical protein W97_08388 [Coniosporium apollinis CBS 100218]
MSHKPHRTDRASAPPSTDRLHRDSSLQSEGNFTIPVPEFSHPSSSATGHPLQPGTLDQNSAVPSVSLAILLNQLHVAIKNDQLRLERAAAAVSSARVTIQLEIDTRDVLARETQKAQAGRDEAKKELDRARAFHESVQQCCTQAGASAAATQTLAPLEAEVQYRTRDLEGCEARVQNVKARLQEKEDILKDLRTSLAEAEKVVEEALSRVQRAELKARSRHLAEGISRLLELAAQLRPNNTR